MYVDSISLQLNIEYLIVWICDVGSSLGVATGEWEVEDGEEGGFIY